MSGAARNRWSVVLAYALLGVVTQMVWMTVMPLTTVAADYYGVSVATIGWLSTIMVVGCVLLSIPAGLLLDRHLKLALAISAVLVAVAACLRLGGTFSWLLAGYCVAAVAQPIVLTAVTGLSRNYIKPKDRPMGIAIATSSQWVGYICAFALGAVFADAGGLPTLMIINAVVAVVAAIALGVALIGPMPFKEAATTRLSEDVKGITRAWSDPTLRLLVLWTIAPTGVLISVMTWSEALLKPAGVSVTAAGLMLVAFVAAGVVGTIALPAPVARRRKEVAIGVFAACVSSVVMLALAIAPGVLTGLVGLVAFGFICLPMAAIMFEIVERLPGHGEGVATGWIYTASNLGGVVVSTIIGFTVASPGLSYAILAGIGLLAVPLIVRLRGPLSRLASAHDDERAAVASQPAAAEATTAAR